MTYQFSTWVKGLGSINGETWSPYKGSLPAEMVDLGLSLIEFVTDEKSSEESLIKKLKDFEKDVGMVGAK